MNKTAAALIGLGTLLLLAACGSSSPKSTAAPAHTLSAAMTAHDVVAPSGKSVAVPAALAHANGDFSATLGADNKLRWHLTFTKLGDAHLVVADIHVGPPGKFGPVLQRLCDSCKSGQHGVLKLKPSVARQLLVGKQWLTLITDQYPDGAVRGQIAVKPH